MKSKKLNNLHKVFFDKENQIFISPFLEFFNTTVDFLDNRLSQYNLNIVQQHPISRNCITLFYLCKQ